MLVFLVICDVGVAVFLLVLCVVGVDQPRRPGADPGDEGCVLSVINAVLTGLRAALLPRPLQHCQVPAACCMVHVRRSQGQQFCRAHCSIARWPPRAA